MKPRLSLGLKFIVATTTVLLLVMSITLCLVSKRHQELVFEQTKMQAKALFQQVVITRRWIADHGGVFVEKLPWVKVNPYLKDPLMEDKGGKKYVRENPAMVTKQLSLYAQSHGLFSFHITSLKLLNPENAPDDFERQALIEFESKKTNEAFKVEKIGSLNYFRYIAPLYVEEACLECHIKQDYREGDVRGAISITVPMEHALSVISTDRKYMIAAATTTAAALVVVLFLITRMVVIGPLYRIRTFMHEFSGGKRREFPVLATGDELEDLSRSFVDMARSIDEYHHCLQEKVDTATSELREKNDELLRLHRTKSGYIAKLSHELRTPLTSIKGAMDYLAARMSAVEGMDGRQDLIVFFEVIKKNAERMIRLVNNVLDYERIELGTFDMHVREINLKDVFEEVIIGFRAEALTKHTEITFDAEDVSLLADEDRMKQVMTNLLSNAMNFSPSSSVISVAVRREGPHAHVSVSDAGPGIPEDERRLVFGQFYSKGVKNGTGLGLAICKGIIEAHGGLIGVEGSDRGGSRFYFSVPIQKGGACGEEKKAACSR